jgi:Ca2+-binding RTX toxin-like protein
VAYYAGTSGDDTIQGTDGDDVINGGLGHDYLRGGSGNDRIKGGDGADLLKGGDGADILRGGSGVDRLDGGRGNDTLGGDAGDDRIMGGAGADILSGGEGYDAFIYTALSDSTVANPDVIQDFTGDSLVLDQIDANSLIAGDQAFIQIDDGGAFTEAGQFRMIHEGGYTRVELNTDADSDPESVIVFVGDVYYSPWDYGWSL